MMDAYAPWFDWSHPMNAVARRRVVADRLMLIAANEDQAARFREIYGSDVEVLVQVPLPKMGHG